jgi:P-type Ca2+ transporter type 2C
MGSKLRKTDQPMGYSHNWHEVQASDVLRHLAVQDRGLTSEDASRRLHQYGPNKLRGIAGSIFLVDVWKQLNGFVIVVFGLISIILAWMGNYIEAGSIIFVVILYAVIGVMAQRRATETSGIGDRRVAPEARVLRDGRTQIVPTENLVPGDIILLDAGDTIPADIRLIKTVNLRVDERILTGGKEPVQKSSTVILGRDIPLTGQKNTAFMGTSVIEGWGHGAVINTGMKTQLGLNMQTLRSVETENTPLQQRMDRLEKGFLLGALILAAVTTVIDLTIKTHLAGLFNSPQLYIHMYSHELATVFPLVASLFLAAIPLGIHSAGTISLLVRIREMLRRKAQIQHLDSVEKLSATTSICMGNSSLLVGTEKVARLWVDGQFLDVGSEDNLPIGDFQVGGQTIDLKNYPAAMTLLWLGVLSSSARMEISGKDREDIQIVGDPSESALLVAAAKAGAFPIEIRQAYPRVGEEILDAERKLKITISSVREPTSEDDSPFQTAGAMSWNIVAVKGPPEELLSLCDRYQLMNDNFSPSSDTSPMETRSASLVNYQIMTDENVDLDSNLQARIMAAYQDMARDALQVVGLAYRVENSQVSGKSLTDDLAGDLIFVGLMGLSSEPRSEVILAIERAKQAGLRTILMTEENPYATRSISAASKLLRPGHKICTGMEMDRISDQELLVLIQDVDLFARVSPEQKQRALDMLKANGEVVTMIGDRLEEASVINRADIRVVDGVRGSKFPAGSAEIVIQQDIFMTIVSVIEQARISLGNIRNLVFFMVSSNLARTVFIFLTAILGFPLPFTILQLLWMNIMNIAPALALAVDKGDPYTMNRRPLAPDSPLIPRALGFRIMIRVFTQVIITWTVFMLATNLNTGSMMAFVTLALGDLFCAYTARSERETILHIGIFSNRYMQYAVELSIGLLLLTCYIPALGMIFQTQPLSVTEWFISIGLALIPALVEEITKLYLRRGFTQSHV